jgi:hypothetical protein
MKNRLEPKFTLHPESGVILILLPILMLTILIFISLAVDSARLYQTQLDLQTAADSAVLAAIAARAAEIDETFTNDQNYIERRVNQSMLQLLRERNISLSTTKEKPKDFERGVINENRLTYSGTGDDTNFFVQAQPTAVVGTLLMGRLSSFFNGNKDPNQKDSIRTISAMARTRIIPANIVFIADLSESSRCPESGTCNCTTEGAEKTCREEANGGSLKYERIQEGLKFFLGAFDEERDNVALVMFNKAAWVEVPFQSANNRGFNREQLVKSFNKVFEDEQTAVNEGFGLVPGDHYVPRGTTNITDALITSFEHVVASGMIENKLKVQYVLLTDGAPTAMRGVINNIDSLNSVLIFKGITDENGRQFNVTYEGPGYFTPSEVYKANMQNRTLVPLIPAINDDVHNCYGINGERRPEVYSIDIESRESIASECLGGEIKIPCPNSPGVNMEICEASSLILGDLTGSIEDGTFKKIYYHTAIQAAQVLRQHRGTIYTIGWGESDITTDPYGNLIDGVNVKPFFLSNLANDKDGLFSIINLNSSIKSPLDAAEDFDFPQYRKPEIRQNKSTSGTFRKESAGAFYNPRPDDNGVELRKSLELIAREINAKLIEPVRKSDESEYK